MYLCFMIKFKEFVISIITFAIYLYNVFISKCSLYSNRNFTYLLDKHTHLLEKYDIEIDTRTTQWHSFSPNNAWVNYAMVSIGN